MKRKADTEITRDLKKPAPSPATLLGPNIWHWVLDHIDDDFEAWGNVALCIRQFSVFSRKYPWLFREFCMRHLDQLCFQLRPNRPIVVPYFEDAPFYIVEDTVKLFFRTDCVLYHTKDNASNFFVGFGNGTRVTGTRFEFYFDEKTQKHYFIGYVGRGV